MILDVLPWIGLGPIRFGMTPREVRRLLGEKQTYEDWMGGNLNDSLLYPGLVLEFSENDRDGPLEHSGLCIVHARPRDDIWLFGKRLGAWTRGDLVAYVDERSWERRETAGCLELDDLRLDVNFEDGGRVEQLYLDQPYVVITTLRRKRGPSPEFQVCFRGLPLRKECRCPRTRTRWELTDIHPTPSFEGHEGTLRPLEGGEPLRPGDALLPAEEPPRVETRGSTVVEPRT